jgi:antitoxin component YwqK of YwqJK toxin-antitoxin module
MKRDKTPFNDKGQAHGYWTTYYCDNIMYEGHYVNGKVEGLWIYYWLSGYKKGNIREKQYVIR